MTDEIKISKPKVRVVLERDDGRMVQVDVQTDNRDAVRFDIMRPRKNWPGGDEAPMLWLTVQAWSALKRAGDDAPDGFVDACKDVDKFFDVCVDVMPLGEDGQPVVDLDQLMKGGGMIARPTDPASD